MPFLLPRGFSVLKNDYGTCLKQRRQTGFGKQQTVADAVGISRSSLSLIESGRAVPRTETMDRLLDVLDADWSLVAVPGVAKRARFFDGTLAGERRLEMGRALRAGRRRERITLRRLADLCGVSAAQLSRIERGEGARSGVYELHDGGADPQGASGLLRFAHPELARLEALGNGPALPAEYSGGARL